MIKSYSCNSCEFKTFDIRNIKKHPHKEHNINEISLKINETSRICGKCYKIKNNDEFKGQNRQCNNCCLTNKKYRDIHKKEIAEGKKIYAAKPENKIKIRTRQNKWEQDRRDTDVKFKLIQNYRSRVTKYFKAIGEEKNIKYAEYMGLPRDELAKWIEYNFDSNMSWENYGEYWQIDHVIPCSSFDVKNKEELLKCFHWTNIRPLEKSKNNKKNDTIDYKQIFLQEIRVSVFKNNLRRQQVQTAGTP